MGERARLAERARRAMGGKAGPQVDAGRRADAAHLEEAHERDALELAIRIGASMLSIGVGAAEVTSTVLRVAAAYGLTNCQVDVTYTSITVGSARDGAAPLTGFRVVKHRIQDFARLHAVSDLADEVVRTALDVQEAHRRLDAVVDAPPRYRRLVVTVALAGMAAAVGILLGGGWQVAVVAAIATGGIDRLTRYLDRIGLPYFFQQALGAAVTTSVAVALVLLEIPIRTSLVVGAGIVVLLAGLSFVGAAEDAISGFYVTAAARAFEVVTLTAGIVVGIGAVLSVARRFKVPLAVLAPADAGAPLPVEMLAAAVIAGCFAIASYARMRAALVAATAGGLGWATSTLALGIGADRAVAAFAAAAVVGFCGDSIRDRLRVPPLLVAVCGIVALLPGLTIYQGLFAVVIDGDMARGAGPLVQAGSVALGLAAGVTLGHFLAIPARNSADRFEAAVRRHASNARD